MRKKLIHLYVSRVKVPTAFPVRFTGYGSCQTTKLSKVQISPQTITMFTRLFNKLTKNDDTNVFHTVSPNDMLTVPLQVRVQPAPVAQPSLRKRVRICFPGGNSIMIEAEYISELYQEVAAHVSVWNNARKNNAVSALPRVDFSLHYNRKLLAKRGARLVDYNIQSHYPIQVEFYALHGGDPEYCGKKNKFTYYDCRTGKKVPQSFNRQNSKRQKRKAKHMKNLLRGLKATHYESNIHCQSADEKDGFFGDISQISTLFSTVNNDFVIKLIEDVAILMMYIMRAKNMGDVALAITTFVKLRVHKSLVGSISKQMIKHFENDEIEMQSIDKLRSLRKIVDQYEQVWDVPVVKKLYKFMMFSLSYSLFEGMGLTFDNLKYDAFEREAIKRQYHKRSDFIHCIIDTTLFLAERGYQAYTSGSLDPIFHGDVSYQKWYDEYLDLKRKSNYLGNCEAHGIEYHTYLQKLDEVIEQGECIVKYSAKIVGQELRFLKMALNDMQMIKAEELSKKSAAQERKAPFAILIEGGSSVGKSTFSKMMFKFYGKIMGLPINDEYIYTRNAADPFWSGWTTAKWGLRLDDIAFMKPSLGLVDPTLMELICVVNNVPFCPNQAELKDKGKTPVKAKFVIATTNTIDLNANAYFACPLAVQRRLPIIVSLKPKSEYQKPGMPEFINPDALPQIEESWPDYWSIECKQVKPAQGAHGQMAEIIPIPGAKFENIKDFLRWFGEQSSKFEEIQRKAMTCDTKMSDFNVCRNCFALSHECSCGVLECSSKLPVFKPLEMQGLMDWFSEKGSEIAPEDVAARDAEMEDIIFGEPLRNTPIESVPVNMPFEANGNTYVKRDDNGRIFVTPFSTSKYDAYMCRMQEQKMSAGEMYGDYATIIDRMMCKPENPPTIMGDMVSVVVEFGMRLYFDYSFVRQGVRWAATLPLVRTMFWRYLGGYTRKTRVVRAFIGLLGENIGKRFNKVKNWHLIVAAISTASALWLGYKLVRRSNKRVEDDFETEAEENQRNIAVLKKGLPEMQGLHYSQLPKTEKENVWKVDDYQTTSFDINPTMMNYQALGRDKFIKTVGRNIASIKVKHDSIVGRPGKALCVGGHLFVTNNHIFADADDFDVDMVFETAPQQVSSNCRFTIDKESLFRLPEHDLVFFEVNAIAPKKDLRPLIAKKSFEGKSKGTLIGRTHDGALKLNNVTGIQQARVFAQHTQRAYDHWQMDVAADTIQGDCGSVLFMETASGYMLGGLHQLGGQFNRAYSVRLNIETVELALKHFGKYMIQSCPPELSAPGVVRPWTRVLHEKSPVRFIQEGCAAVYGSFEGFRPRMTSKVCTSYLGDEIKVLRGWNIPFGKPVMNTWMPWHLALKDIMGAKHNYKRNVLEKVRKSFVNDILSGLKEKDLDELCILDVAASMNGVQGVQFVDKMNFNTSMGFPWKTSKKNFLEPLAGVEGLPEAKTFTQDILDRIQDIIGRYKNGMRWMPVFCGNLKDEAKEEAKIIAGKTRVFTGGPADWSTVVRMYLLSFVRIVQNNTFVFEAGPGTVAQSLEWEKIREYLTQHGADRMVAGDYGKFDKKMLPDFVLAAFEIIIDIHRKAGWTEEDLQVIRGIAEDVAYPLTDFNGDLIEFFGTNPSGQPLTVIINSLVNCLYVRYCYHELNPEKEIATFKSNVSLMTYGDDNTFGVSNRIDWFDHTTLQSELAKIGVEYTMAEKTAKSVPFIHIDDISFLKRKWRWDNDIEAYVCPLEEMSIRKMLCVWLPSKTVIPECQMVSVIESAMNEFFFYGRERFEQERKFFVQLCENPELKPWIKNSTLPTWEELYQRFWKNSAHVKIERKLSVKTKSVIEEILSKKSQCVSYSVEPVWELEF